MVKPVNPASIKYRFIINNALTQIRICPGCDQLYRPERAAMQVSYSFCHPIINLALYSTKNLSVGCFSEIIKKDLFSHFTLLRRMYKSFRIHHYAINTFTVLPCQAHTPVTKVQFIKI